MLPARSEEHTSELQSRENLVCRLLLEKKNHHPLPPLSSCLRRRPRSTLFPYTRSSDLGVQARRESARGVEQRGALPVRAGVAGIDVGQNVRSDQITEARTVGPAVVVLDVAR